MGTFDLDTFAKAAGGGKDFFQSLGTAHGLPSCMLNLGASLLKLLPSSILGDMSDTMRGAQNKADEVVKGFFQKLQLNQGIFEFNTEDGTFSFISDSSKNKLDSNSGGLLGSIGSFVNALNAATAFAGGLYRNYQAIKGQIDAIKDCFKGYHEHKKYQSGTAGQAKMDLARQDPEAYNDNLAKEYAVEFKAVQGSIKFIDDCEKVLKEIDIILLERSINPSLEPCFIDKLADIVSGTDFCFEEPTIEREDVFRLVYGPPRAKSGQFLLSVDGLYYDSQTDGLVPALKELRDRGEELVPSHKWMFKHDPSLGGKGDHVGARNIVDYIDTLFDPDIEDESPKLTIFYDADHFLQVLKESKNKRILDLSGHLTTMQGTGESTALVENTRQSILSEIALFESKINRRRKQIELAVKAPSIFGGRGGIFKPGEIPINDFSYLREYQFSFDIDKQKALVLDQDDVSGVVLPYEPIFVMDPGNPHQTNINHLLLPEIGVGDIITSDSSATGQVGTTQSITDDVVTNGLIGVYNFLSTDIADPSSMEFNVINCAKENPSFRAQLAGGVASSIFYSGLGIPYFEGISKNSGASVTGLGSYAKLPNIPAYQDLTYGQKGFSFESWFFAPGLTLSSTAARGGGWRHDQSASSLYRIMLGCENTGRARYKEGTVDILRMGPDFGDSYTRGMLMGFTADRRITVGEDPSNDPALNSPLSSCFFMAPTQSFDGSSVGFINKDPCPSATEWRALRVAASDAGPDGAKFAHSCSSFMHLVVSVDNDNDKIDIYLDKNLMATSSISEVFGTTRYMPINLPNFVKDNSFEYSSTTLNTDAPSSLIVGPKLNGQFTPWIIGGGYTDGMALSGNFMGGTYGGILSGFKGHMGSIKFYSRPLNSAEVKINYTSQQAFFKNIQTPAICAAGDT